MLDSFAREALDLMQPRQSLACVIGHDLQILRGHLSQVGMRDFLE
jgi:hypothetical protein